MSAIWLLAWVIYYCVLFAVSWALGHVVVELCIMKRN